MEILVYVLSASFVENLDMPLKTFVDKAEQKGNVYTLKGFANAFNCEEINAESNFIRFGIVDDNGNLFELPDNMLVEIKNLKL